MDLSQLSFILQEQCHIFPGQKLAIGVSGGPDSICCLHALKHLGYELIALHLDHQLRKNSADDAIFVKEICSQMGVVCEVASLDVDDYRKQNHLSLEEAARILRYQFLFRAAKRANASALVTAHHAGDQVETVLMHIIRGTGLSGLAGMSYVSLLPEFDSELPIVRPLLDVWKEDILIYCQQNDLQYVVDETNQESTYFRNWLRNELIPQIEQVNPKFKQGIQRMSNVISAEADILTKIQAESLKQVVVSDGDGYIILDKDKCNALPVAIGRGICRSAIQRLRPILRDIDFLMIERFRMFILSGTESRSMDLAAGLKLSEVDGQIILCDGDCHIPITQYPQFCSEASELVIGSDFELTNEWTIVSAVVDIASVNAASIQNAPTGEAWLDLDLVHLPLQVTTCQPGDRFQPLGFSGHTTSMSDYFINHKIPAAARKKYPLVRDVQRIVWVPGMQVSEAYKVNATSKQLLHLKLVKK